MQHLKQGELVKKEGSGRVMRLAFGDGASVSREDCFASRVTLTPSMGGMKPHWHELEVIYIIDAKCALVRSGSDSSVSDRAESLSAGDFLLFEEGEWHAFDFDSSDGSIELVTFFTKGSHKSHVE